MVRTVTTDNNYKTQSTRYMKKTKLILSAALALQLAACNNNTTTEKKDDGSATVSAKPGISEQPFGEFEGKPVTE